MTPESSSTMTFTIWFEYDQCGVGCGGVRWSDAAPVSMPCKWDNMRKSLCISHAQITTTIDRNTIKDQTYSTWVYDMTTTAGLSIPLCCPSMIYVGGLPLRWLPYIVSHINSWQYKLLTSGEDTDLVSYIFVSFMFSVWCQASFCSICFHGLEFASPGPPSASSSHIHIAVLTRQESRR